MSDGVLNLLLRFLTENNVAPSGDVREIAVGTDLESVPRAFFLEIPPNIGSIYVTFDTVLGQRVRKHVWSSEYVPIKIRRIVAVETPKFATILTPPGSTQTVMTFDVSGVRVYGVW